MGSEAYRTEMLGVTFASTQWNSAATVGCDSQTTSPNSTRRQALSTLAAAAIFTVVGCARFSSDNELDRSAKDLDEALSEAPVDTTPELMATSRQIQLEAKSMIVSQEEFSSEFDRRSIDPKVSDGALLKLVSRYERKRKVKQDNLLLLQDKLHEAVPQEIWPEVREILTRKARIVSIQISLRQN